MFWSLPLLDEQLKFSNIEVFKKFVLRLMLMYVPHVCVTQDVQERVLHPLQLELEVTVGSLVWMLGTYFSCFAVLGFILSSFLI